MPLVRHTSIKPSPGCRAAAIKQMLTPWLRRAAAAAAAASALLYVSFLRLRRLLGVLAVHALPSVTAPIQHPATVLFSHPASPKPNDRPEVSTCSHEPRGFRLMPRFRPFRGITFDRRRSGHPLVHARSCRYLFLFFSPTLLDADSSFDKVSRVIPRLSRSRKLTNSGLSSLTCEIP